MQAFLAKLIGGLARGASMWLGDHAASLLNLTGADVDTLKAGLCILVTGILWAGIHAAEEWFKNRNAKPV